MATTAWIAKAGRKAEMVKRHKAKRDALKAKIIDPTLDQDEKREAVNALNKMPKNGSPVRIRRRCGATGHPRANYRKFNLNRIRFRKMALEGLLPGVTKASW
ncbi:MAG: 30S ribosomal protein S14 [Deltaproteobacteria bacterium]|nr:30S ribosomal protein S14 [Deltaproteobacteria bacterium]